MSPPAQHVIESEPASRGQSDSPLIVGLTGFTRGSPAVIVSSRLARDAVVRAETELAPAFGGGPLCAHTGYVRELANQITKTRPWMRSRTSCTPRRVRTQSRGVS